MASAAKKRSKRPQAPTPRPIRSRRLPLWIYFGGGAGMVVVGGLIVVLTTRGGGSSSAVAGNGLYRSTDNGETFELVTSEVGGAVMALAVTRSGDILAGDMQRGLLESTDGGRSWRQVLNAQLAGLAISPSNPKLILATG